MFYHPYVLCRSTGLRRKPAQDQKLLEKHFDVPYLHLSAARISHSAVSKVPLAPTHQWKGITPNTPSPLGLSYLIVRAQFLGGLARTLSHSKLRGRNSKPLREGATDIEEGATDILPRVATAKRDFGSPQDWHPRRRGEASPEPDCLAGITSPNPGGLGLFHFPTDGGLPPKG